MGSRTAGVLSEELAQQHVQSERADTKDDRSDHSDPIEVALHHSGSTDSSTATNTSSEHVGHAASPPRVKQDQEDQQE